MKVEIQVQGGTVTISVGGPSAPSSPTGAVTSQGFVGGDASIEPAKSGGGGIGYSYGTLVIGPIVVDCCGSQAADSKSGGDASIEPAKSGGDASIEPAKSGGDASIEPAKSGGAGLSSGTVVIGPVVFCGSYGGASSGDSQASDDTVSKTIAVMPK
jgi:hypothetical protein